MIIHTLEAMRSATEARSLLASDKKMESAALVFLAYIYIYIYIYIYTYIYIYIYTYIYIYI